MKKVNFTFPRGTHKLEDSFEGATSWWHLQGIRSLKAVECLVGALFVFTAVASAAVVETIDAQTYEGEITRLDEKGATIKTKDGLKTLPASDLSKVTFQDTSKIPDLLKTSGQAVVLTQAGDVLPARAELLRMEKNRLRVDPGEIGMAMELPLKVLRAILLPAAGQSCEDVQRLCKELQCTPGTKDLLVIVRKDDKPQKVTGTLVGIAEGQIRFTYRGKERTVKADRVRAIWLAEPIEAFRLGWGRLRTTDGCVYAFWDIKLDDGLYTLRRLWEPALNFISNDVADITFRSDRLMYLSQINPVKVKQHGMFDKAIPYRVNRSAGGGPLRLAGQRYDTGLGLHSFCELTYDLGGKYRVFIATAGIDDAVRPNGVATLTICADDKPLLPATTLTGRDTPLPLRLDLRGAKTMTIRVDFGPDKLDASDHVNLAGARLVK